jgi:small subunit ribosomal protein S5
MTTEEKTQTKKTPTTNPSSRTEGSSQGGQRRASHARGRGPARKGGATGGRPRKRRERSERPKSEFEQKIIGIRRVTRVAAGGRRFSFSVAMVIGDRNGRVGVGIGKAGDTALAIEKANRDARSNMITVKRTKENSLPHEIEAKYCGSVITMMPSPGKGLVAGSSVRNVLDLAGITDISAKILSRSKNKLNNAHAALRALALFS